MYLQHFGLDEHPFRITPHTDFFYAGSDRGAVLNALVYASQHEEGIIKVTGEVGSGKSMLCRMLIEQLPSSVVSIYLANPSLNRDEILHAIAEDIGLNFPPTTRVATVIRQLQEILIQLYSEGKRVLLLVDEAHAMPLESLEEIRLLSNLESNRHKLLQIILFGQQELDLTLNESNMRQLRERITQQFALTPLNYQHIGEYINFRLQAAGYRGLPLFENNALQLITKASYGLARRVNILADKSLLAAYTAGAHKVTAEHAKYAIKDAGYNDLAAKLYQIPTSIKNKTLRSLLGLTAIGVLALSWIAFNHVHDPSFPIRSASIQQNTTITTSPSLDRQAKLASTSVATPTPEISTLAHPPTATSERDKAILRANKWIEKEEQAYTIQMMAAKIMQPGLNAQIDNWISQNMQENSSGLNKESLMIFAEETSLSLTYGSFPTKIEAIQMFNTLPEKIRPSLMQIRSRAFLRGVAKKQ